MPPSYKNDKQFVDDVVRCYLQSIESAYTQSSGARGLNAVGMDGITREEAANHARIAYSLLSQSRLFAIHPERYRAVYHACDQYTTELSGYDWQPFSGKPEPKAVSDALTRTYEEGASIPFPSPMPFDSIFFGFGGRMALTTGPALYSRMTPEGLARLGVQTAHLVGFVLGSVGQDNYAYALLELSGQAINGRQIGIVCIYEDSQWTQPLGLDPWVIPMLIQQINDHKTTILEEYVVSLTNRLDRKEFEKKGKLKIPLPQPFYIVRLQEKLIEQAVQAKKKTTLKREWSHRWDVRCHEVVHVVKGKYPMPDPLVKKLKKRGYRIYLTSKPTSDDWERLNRRDIHIATDEWVAVLSFQRAAHISGPKNKPYIPAARI